MSQSIALVWSWINGLLGLWGQVSPSYQAGYLLGFAIVLILMLGRVRTSDMAVAILCFGALMALTYAFVLVVGTLR